MADTIFPFVDTVEISSQNDTTIPKEYAWDFTNNTFIMTGNKPMVVEGLEAIKVWIYKTLNTERYRYIAYSWNYGHEIENFTGQRLSNEVLQSEAKRYIKETLLVNIHIKDVSNFKASIDGSKVNIGFTAITDLGEVNINV